MRKLPHRQLNIGAFNGLFERAGTAGEYGTHIPMLGMMGKNLFLHVLVDWNRSCLASFRASKLDQSLPNLLWL